MDSPAFEATKACFREKAYILSGDPCMVLLINTKNPPVALGRQFLQQAYSPQTDLQV